ncbi:hypothetical protein LOZ86_10530 [Pectobacterium parvum]|uniref:Lipoprotein n=1 Tax=Pectobacterium parvum TaxID=2778550 RepID=A0ABW8FTX3_9GAMM|nr:MULTISPECIES: hypothetical protein [Pectobacterium]MCU1801507.1 hypothetical protein [Pectobacterium parvum]UFK41212.1 hypothetical protein LOZ86_10530 [Pectobacterium parvum]UVD95580.1 hypothetical protein NV347_10730 [Pectobacterium parvum]
MTRSVVSALAMMLLTGCLATRTVYVPAQCIPLPTELTQPVLVPLPPVADWHMRRLFIGLIRY